MSGYVWSCLLTKLCDEYAVTNAGILLTKRRWHFGWSTMNTYSPQLNGDLQFSVIRWLAFQLFLPLILCSSSNLWFGTTLKMTSTIDISAGENPFLRPTSEEKKSVYPTQLPTCLDWPSRTHCESPIQKMTPLPAQKASWTGISFQHSPFGCK